MPQGSHAKEQLEPIWKTPGHLKWRQMSMHGQQNQDPGVIRKTYLGTPIPKSNL